MLPAFNIGIFFENFLIKFSSFFEKPVVPITTLFFSLDAIFRISKVHLGTVKSIIKSTFLMDLVTHVLFEHYDPSWLFLNEQKLDLANRLSKQKEREKPHPGFLSAGQFAQDMLDHAGEVP